MNSNINIINRVALLHGLFMYVYGSNSMWV